VSEVQILPVIMCGGAGTRLWPLSVPDEPKPFHRFGAEHTLFQQTVLRTAPSHGFLAPLVVCGAGHLDLVINQLAEIGVEPLAIVTEPMGRNTAAVAAVASTLAAHRAPGAVVLLLSADSLIADADAFRATIAAAAPVARERIVTFGIKPDRPEIAYGYILRGPALAEGVFEAEKFEEKPTLETAKAYLADGRYLWNAGLFIFAPRVLLAEMTKSRDDIRAGALAALPAGATNAKVVALDPERFAACPAESIDYAVMEATSKAAVAPCDIGWADVGSWSEVWRLGARDGDDNLTQGAVVLKDVEGSLVLSSGPTVAAIGVSDLIIVATPDAVVVLPKSRAQEVKGIVEGLQKAAKEKAMREKAGE
jgi:mannose-1-phosphate guanylyltransferase/mannose-6-phosphate isomerase